MNAPILMDRGQQSEVNVALQLKELKKQGVILDYVQTQRFSSDDKKGIDFRITAISGDMRIIIPLQVKSSAHGINLHDIKPGQTIPAVNGQSDTLMNDLKGVIQIYKDPSEAKKFEAVKQLRAGRPREDKSKRLKIVTEFAEWREKNKLSRSQIDEMLGFTPGYTRNFEANLVAESNPKFDAFVKLMKDYASPELAKSKPVELKAPDKVPAQSTTQPSVKQAVESLKQETEALESEITKMQESLSEKQRQLTIKRNNLQDLTQAWATIKRIVGGVA